MHTHHIPSNASHLLAWQLMRLQQTPKEDDVPPPPAPKPQTPQPETPPPPLSPQPEVTPEMPPQPPPPEVPPQPPPPEVPPQPHPLPGSQVIWSSLRETRKETSFTS